MKLDYFKTFLLLLEMFLESVDIIVRMFEFYVFSFSN